MRHGKKINHLGRTSSHRKAMLANMAVSLIMHKRINTTLAKAKALRKYVEPLINRSKDDTTHSRRIVFSYHQNKEAVTELFREISKKIENRPGGYTRILKTGNRIGDAAEMCFIELVDYNENMLSGAADAKKKTTRRSRRKKSEEPVHQVVEKSKAKPTAKTEKPTVKQEIEKVVEKAEEVVKEAVEEINEGAEKIVKEVEQVVENVRVETDISENQSEETSEPEAKPAD
jgi:large subunit ribosomal protein L17